MSSVPVSRREKHDFLATHKLLAIRKTVTELALNDFGYDKEKLEKKIDKFEQNIGDFENKPAVVAKMRKKNETFYEQFVKEETIETRKILRDVVSEFEMGNSIFPSGEARFMEFCERRKHIDLAIGRLYCLKQELQYIAETLPGDKNRYDPVIKEIKAEVSLMKGVRRAANKYLKDKPEDGKDESKKGKKPDENKSASDNPV